MSDECKKIADEIIAKLFKVCNNNQSQVDKLLNIGVEMFAKSIQ